jgi:hypothetical protein
MEDQMTTRSFVATSARCALDLGGVGRRAAQAAAVLTVGGAVTLGIFFTAGEPWGTINDWLSIGLAGATVPIALDLARRNPRSASFMVGAGLDLAGVVVTSASTLLLISRRMTFEESLPGVMGGQALVGCWLVLVGLAAWSDPSSRRIAGLGIVGGAGLLATALGLEIGGMESPVAALGFVAGLIGMTGFYAILGRRSGRSVR